MFFSRKTVSSEGREDGWKEGRKKERKEGGKGRKLMPRCFFFIEEQREIYILMDKEQEKLFN